MRIVKFHRVASGLQCRSLGMAEFATERSVDLVMADQAIGHLREIRFRQRSGLLHAPMAGRAGVRAIEMAPDVTRRREIRFRIDGRANHRRDIPQREVFLMIEPRQKSRPRLTDARFLMTAQTDSPRREVVIFEPRRGWNGSMAGNAGQLLRQLQVQFMRKRPLGGGRARYSPKRQRGDNPDQKCKSHFPL